jgi:hypothetical protein
MVGDALTAAAHAVGWLIKRVRVDKSTIRFTDDNAWKRYIFFTPLHVSAAINLWENGVKPIPFGFTLRRQQAAQVIDLVARRSYPSQVKRALQVTTRQDNRKRKSVQGVTVLGGKPLPLMPRQTTRMFGQCGLSPKLFRKMAGLE